MSTSSIYNHRTLQPSGRSGPAQPAGQPGPVRLNESLDAIKQEFEAMTAEVELAKREKEEVEGKLNQQVVELNMIRRALYELDTQHNKIRQQYDDELARLRSELASLRHSGGTSGSGGAAGNSGPLGLHSLPSNSASSSLDSASNNVNAPYNDVNGRSRADLPAGLDSRPLPPADRPGPSLDRGRDRSESRPPPRDYVPDHDRERELDRLADQRDPKRLKKRESGDQPPYPSSVNSISTPRLPSSHALYGPANQGPYPPGPAGSVDPSGRPYPPSSNGPPGHPASQPPPHSASSQALPPHSQSSSAGPPSSSAVVPASRSEMAGPVDEFSYNSVPADYRKEGPDWFAAFNPKIKRTLDISLVHSFAHSSVVCCVQFSQDGRFLATGCNQTAQIFDTKSGHKVCELPHESEAHTGDLYIRSVRFSPDGKFLATGAEDRNIRIWDIARKRIRQVFDGHQQEIYSLDFSQDGRLIVSGSGDRTTRIWDMSENTCKVFTITDVVDPATDAGVTSVAISPNANLVAAGSLDNVIRIWDVNTGQLLERLRGHTNSVYSVAFTPDGKGLVTGSLDKTLKLWDVTHLSGGRAKVDPDKGPSSPCVMDFIGHKDYVLSVSMSSDSQWVVSGSKDRCVHVWDSRTASLQLMLQGHKNSVISLDLNSANDLLATGSGDSFARIWSLTRI